MVLIDVKSLEGQFFWGIPVVSCHMKSQRYYCIPSTVYDVIFDTCIGCSSYIFFDDFDGLFVLQDVIPAWVTQMKQDLDLLPSRCFLKFWHMMREDSGMGWSRKGKQTGPPKASFVDFVVFFKGVFFWSWSMIVGERMAGGWCIQRYLFDVYLLLEKIFCLESTWRLGQPELSWNQ